MKEINIEWQCTNTLISASLGSYTETSGLPKAEVFGKGRSFLDNNLGKFQYSALVFCQRPNIFQPLPFGFGRMRKCSFGHSLTETLSKSALATPEFGDSEKKQIFTITISPLDSKTLGLQTQ